jgi:hypothetical protein
LRVAGLTETSFFVFVPYIITALRHNGSKCQDTIETNVTTPNLTITNDTTDDTIETTTSTTAAPDTDNQDATNVVEGDSSEVDESSSNTMNNEPERLINL